MQTANEREWPRIKHGLAALRRKEREYTQRKYLPEKILLVIWPS